MFLEDYHKFDSILDPKNILIRYSWDQDEYGKIAVEQAKQVLAQTEILVIIGYSFPFFNREIDAEILKSYNPSDLNRIYIQDTKERIPIIRTRLKSYIDVKDEMIVHWDDLGAFCIPFEY